MSTRRLITLALLAGLAILVAGGIWLVTVGRATGDRLVATLQPPGAAVEVGGLTVTLTQATFEGSTLLLDVQMVAGEAAVTDPASGWAVISTRGLVPRLEDQAAVPDACAGRALPAEGQLRCRVGFQPTEEQATAELVAVYGRADERASWRLAP